MTTVEERLSEIEGRVTALEQAQNDNTQSLRWLIKSTAQMKKQQDEHTATLADHTRTLADHTRTLSDHTRRLDRIEHEVKSLRTDLPTIVADSMRVVLKKIGG